MSGPSVVRDARARLRDAGLHGTFLVRDLDDGAEVVVDADEVLPMASLVKVPLAVATLERAARGALDLARPVELPAQATPAGGLAGTVAFRHPATIAVEDLLHLAVAVSDNRAADALFDLTPPADVAVELDRLGIAGIAVRHVVAELSDTVVELLGPERVNLAHTLAIGAATTGIPVTHLDTTRANSCSARAMADLLTALWRPSSIDPSVAQRVRDLMGSSVHRQRLAPDLAADDARWSSKTGTVLNLRHEAGVLELAEGRTLAVVAMTASSVAAAVQPEAEAVMGAVARELVEFLLG